ncbi:MAG: ABC transporter ATP-binding protein [Candidatus Berkelbacteria bacterium]|nr:MAG: ABC transporter ATP-binding protein [Candidatus Berkelbacteria bacterium]QQG51403.1 MAG: ABC transporter ATP-binding protein [Candidatus Berkelbacteria bacterium]
MLKARELTVFDKAIPVLTNINLEIKRGEVAAFIGPNNAGKSALLRALAGGFEHYDGEIRVGSYSLKNSEKAKTQLGYLSSPVAFENYLTGLEWLEVVSAAYHLAPPKRIEAILNLADKLNCKDSLYTILDSADESTKQKVGLIASLLHQPSVVLWDEPINSLDPTSQQEVSELARRVSSDGAAVLIATNNLPWAERVAERFFIMDQGEILSDGTLSQLKSLSRAEDRDLLTIYNSVLHGQ